MILDVGCGSRPRGDVNVDLGSRVLARQEDQITRANIYGSVLELPFANDSFDTVHFHGILHHLSDPISGWKEMVRVARVMLVGVEPMKLNLSAWRDKYHIYHGFWKRQLIRITSDDRLERVIYYYHGSNPLNILLHVTAFKKEPIED